MNTPNIRPKVQPHTDCWRQDFRAPHGFVGDVRYCPHSKVQVRTKAPPNSRMAGPGTDWWRTLSPFWNRRQYKQATQALGATA